MAETPSIKVSIEERDIVFERMFDAPRELVFKVFKEPEHLARWWGPKGWILPVCKIDFRPGGVWHYCMKCVDENQGDFFGMESWGKGVYQEIVEPDKIVYVDFFSDAEGNTVEGMPSALITLTFIEHEGKTILINRTQYESSDALKSVTDMGVVEGFTQTWDRLEELLSELQSR